jgi:hypothetical protein
MPDEPKKIVVTRSKMVIDEDLLVARASRGWSMRAIAASFGVDEATIRRRYSAKIEAARHHGAAKLLDVLWTRGVQEKSDQVLLNLANRIIGPTPRDPEQMQQVNVQINNASRLPREELTKKIDALKDEDDE